MKIIKETVSFLKSSVFTFALSLLTFHCAFADPSSTNYQIAESYLPGGSGSSQSTNYKADEGMLDFIARANAASTNYALEGKIGITGAAPIAVINSVSPGDYSRLFSDENASFTVTAQDPDSDSLQYLAKQDSTTKVAAQSSNVLTWALSGADLGRHTMTLQVIDPDGTVLKQQVAYVVRHPVK